MSDVTHLLTKHRKEMTRLEKQARKEQRRRNQKAKQMERMVDNALRANNASAAKDKNVA